jgi:hypothetical protein
MRVEFRIGEQKYKPTRQSGEGFFSPLTDPFYILGQLFSVLVSENAGLLVILAVLKNLSSPLLNMSTKKLPQPTEQN